MAAKVENCIAKEEAWIDEKPPWKENPKDVPEGSYYKKFELAREYLKVCETCEQKDHHVYYRCYQYDQLVPQDYMYNLK